MQLVVASALLLLPATGLVVNNGGGTASLLRRSSSISPVEKGADPLNSRVDYLWGSREEQPQQPQQQLSREEEAAFGAGLVEAAQARWPGLSDEGSPPPEGRVYCSRSLNMGAIRAIGYDMDYTVVQYKWRNWENLAYECTKEELVNYGFPVQELKFSDPELICRGLVLDRNLGNFVKIDRHGFVRRAMHGDSRLSEEAVEFHYGRSTVDLRDPRYSFLNTLFSLSEGVLYSQLVQKLDSGALVRDSVPPFDPSRVSTYADLHRAVSKALSRAHNVNSRLKRTISKDPAFYTQREVQKLRKTFQDQRNSGMKLALITNSDWSYTDTMMRFVLDDNEWRDRFDVVVCSSRKPDFFTPDSLPCYELVFKHEDEEPLMRATDSMRLGNVYLGGSARQVERLFGVTAADGLLYVGDHIFTDANKAKVSMRWRTALVVMELESEILAAQLEGEEKKRVEALLVLKDGHARIANVLRCELRRWEAGVTGENVFDRDSAHLAREEIETVLLTIATIDHQIRPLMREQGTKFNKYWGYLTRAGYNDKSHLARQIEKYADIYFSRVTDLLPYTPYHHFRAAAQSLAHELIVEDYCITHPDDDDQPPGDKKQLQQPRRIL